MLLLKLILTPLLVGGITLLGRKLGPTISGWLVGLPLTSAPIALFLALEQGTEFAARAAQGTLIGVISVAVFCVTYSWLSLRLGWFVCWLGSWAMFFVSTGVFEYVALPLRVVVVLVVCCLVIALFLLPRNQGKVIETRPPAWDIYARMLITTAFVLVLTGVASVLGSRLSGLLAPLPLYGTIFAIFTQRFQGAAPTRQLLRGVIVGSFAFSTFFLTIAIVIIKAGIVAAFGCALLGVLVVQGCTLRFINMNHQNRE